MLQKKLLLMSLILMMGLTGAMQGHGGGSCCGSSSHGNQQSLWLNSTWQGFVVGMIIVGPIQKFWNDTAGDWIKEKMMKNKKQCATAHGACSHDHEEVDTH